MTGISTEALRPQYGFSFMPHNKRLAPYPCEAVDETIGRRASCPITCRGRNAFLTRFPAAYGISRSSAGGADTMLSEYIEIEKYENLTGAQREGIRTDDSIVG